MGEKDIFSVKKDVQNTIKNKYLFPKDNKFTGLIILSNTKVLSQLLEGCKFLSVNFVVVTKDPI